MNVDQLMHPENLSNVELLHILQSLCVSEPLDSSRSHIIEIFKKVAMPLPQRNVSITNAKSDIQGGVQFYVSPNCKREMPVNVCEIDVNIKKMKLNSFSRSTEDLYLTHDKLNDLHISNRIIGKSNRSAVSRANPSWVSLESNLRKSALKRKSIYECNIDRKQLKTSTILHDDG